MRDRIRLSVVVLALTFAACPNAADPRVGEGEGDGGGEGEGGEGEGGEGEGGAEGEGGEGEGAGEGEGEGTPDGCVDDVSAGDHEYECDGVPFATHIPEACAGGGCGLIVELHGDTGDGSLIDAHLQLMAQGDVHGYIVAAPTGPPFGFGQPGSTWHSDDDAIIAATTQSLINAFDVDTKRVHVTGFSRGGFVTWRLICDHSDLFVSAAPGAAGDGSAFGEGTCFSDGRTPSHHIPILFLMGRTDAAVGYASMQTIRDAALSTYAAVGPNNDATPAVISSDNDYEHDRWTNADGVVFETFDHAYETVADGPWADGRGHCIPGSTLDPYAPQYAVACEGPNAFVWGDEVMAFFLAHPAP